MSEFNERYKKLNPAQQAAVTHIAKGPLLVIAGPGTGKTELLSMRAANILHETDALPSNILCITFTESGASSMRSRMANIIGVDAYKIAVHTFHSFGTEVMNQNSSYFFRGADFHPADDLTQYEILREIFEELPHANPLSSRFEDTFVYLNEAMSAISDLKKSGLTNDELLQILSANEIILDQIEPELSAILTPGIKKDTAARLAPIAHKVAELPARPLPRTITPYENVLALELARAIDEAETMNSTKPITAWKNAWFRMDDTKKLVFKDRANNEKLRALAHIYYRYLTVMESRGLYDYDDMIMNVVHAIETQPDLKANLQEKFQYIMVDEFQDTNLAQLRLLFNLTDGIEQPDVMAVGDDDQAIFSFQGATQDNITRFRAEYGSPDTIVLTENYRSAALILDTARLVITQNTGRLEDHLDEISKQLHANFTPQSPLVTLTEYEHPASELSDVARDIKRKIDSGIQPASIAILARRHSELMSIVPFLSEQGIDTNYERRDNALDNELIMLLEKILIVVEALASGDLEAADELLIEILSHPAFGFSTLDIWKLTLSAHKERSLVAEAMSVSPIFKPVLVWLTELASASQTISLEQLIDQVIGEARTSSDKSSEAAQSKLDDAFAEPTQPVFHSPLYSHYFSSEKLAQQPGAYLETLEALRTIRDELRAHLEDTDTPELTDLLNFFAAHHELNRPITIVRHRSDSRTGAIQVMTAHKSKGLEFDYVYIIGALDNRWGEKARSMPRKIGYVANLRIAPAGDSIEERTRLFYVAMTRARIGLNISYNLENPEKPSLLASFLAGADLATTQVKPERSIAENETIARLEWHDRHTEPLTTELRELLLPTLERYKLSATHLNMFLDVTRGGLHGFLLNNLLHFPQAKSPSAAYGTAMHAALSHAHMYAHAHEHPRPSEDIIADFEKLLREQRLASLDEAKYLERGSEALQTFLASSMARFSVNDLSELRFADQGVQLSDARLTGALDVVHIDHETKSLTVTDYKTGKASRDWKGKTEFEKIKLHKYRQQLMFYQLLIEHSRDFSAYSFTGGILQFVEPTMTGEIIALDQHFTRDELDEFTKLVEAVWRHILTLDLPDTTKYSQNLQGILDFERDLIDDL